MELSTFCEICSNKEECGIDSATCRHCAAAWTGKGAPVSYQATQLSLASALNRHAGCEQSRAKEVLRDKFEGVSIQAYQNYTRDSLATRVKILNNIIAYAEAELNLISKEGQQ